MKFFLLSLLIGFLGHVFYGLLSTENVYIHAPKKKNNFSEDLEKADDYTKTYVYLGGKR